MTQESGFSSQPTVDPQGEHYQKHGEAAIDFGGKLRVTTCSVAGSKGCTVSVSFDMGGGGVRFSMDAAGALQLQALLGRAAEAAEGVDAQIATIAAAATTDGGAQ